MLESLQQQVAANGCQSPEELQSLVRQKVADNALAVERAFADVDYAELGVVSRRDFRDVLGMHVMSLSEDQVVVDVTHRLASDVDVVCFYCF